MAESYYTRVRGRIYGPFDFEGLRSLISDGKLSRAHEVSRDGKNWSQASTIPDLFDRPRESKTDQFEKVASQRKSIETKPSEDPISVPNSAPAPTPVSQVKEWHYMANGAALGPISTEELCKLFQFGSLNRESPVWKQGMPQWVAAGYIPELAATISNPTQISTAFTALHSKGQHAQNRSPKDKTVAILLALFLGGLGIHHFYLGNTLRGIVSILLCFFTLGFGAIFALIEAILMATCSEEDFQRKWCHLEMRFS